MKVMLRHIKPIQAVGTMCIRVTYSEAEGAEVKGCQNMCVQTLWKGQNLAYTIWAPAPSSVLYSFVSHGII